MIAPFQSKDVTEPAPVYTKSIMKPSTKTLEYKPEEIQKLIAHDLGVDQKHVDVKYVIQEVGADVLDRFPGTKQVTSIRVTVKET